jgi:hypothetical protein
MAMKRRFKVSMGDAFPHGVFVVGPVEPVNDFDKSTKERKVQDVSKDSGRLLWQVQVLDGDPEARKGDKTITVKIEADVQPVPPAALPGLPGGLDLRPVVFEGLNVLPYVDDNGQRPRLAWSFRATGLAAPAASAAPAAAGGGKRSGSVGEAA